MDMLVTLSLTTCRSGSSRRIPQLHIIMGYSVDVAEILVGLFPILHVKCWGYRCSMEKAAIFN